MGGGKQDSATLSGKEVSKTVDREDVELGRGGGLSTFGTGECVGRMNDGAEDDHGAFM